MRIKAQQLIDEGVIERVGSKRIGTWIVRY